MNQEKRSKISGVISFVGKIPSKFSGFREGSLLLTIIVIAFIMSNVSPAFMTAGNIRTTAFGFSMQGIIVVGMTVALIAGAFDLSVGSIMGFTGVVAGKMFLMGTNIWLAILIGIAAAVLCGCINAFFVTKIGISPFITTLAMLGIARGASFVLTKGTPLPLRSMPEAFKSIGSGSIAGVPYIVIIFILIAIFGDFMVRRSTILRKVFYTGSNEKAAVLSGINVNKVKFGVFILTAGLAGVAGILSIARFTVATPTFGTGMELTVISAAVIGGASLNGGEGTVFGSVLGIILLGIISSSLVMLSVSVYWQQLISSLILLAAVSLDFINQKRRQAKLMKSVSTPETV
jgi:ribose transport system permease protein